MWQETFVTQKVTLKGEKDRERVWDRERLREWDKVGKMEIDMRRGRENTLLSLTTFLSLGTEFSDSSVITVDQYKRVIVSVDKTVINSRVNSWTNLTCYGEGNVTIATILLYPFNMLP